MTNTVESAGRARQMLAEALGALQAPEAGDLVDSVAGAVARAMGALHKIETTQGASISESGPIARDAVRDALAALQNAPADNPVVAKATEGVAGSLGIVHGLAQQAEAAAVSVQAATQPAPQVAAVATPVAAPAQTPPAGPPAGLGATQRVEARPAAATRPSTPDQNTGPTSNAPPHDRGAASLAQTALSEPPPAQGQNPQIASTQQSRQVAEQVAAPQDRGHKDSKHAAPPPHQRPAGAIDVEANLGAHSPTNFYKGLSGNDVIDDGGLFVATYKIPSIGAAVWITVNLPGGYDFQAAGSVRWTRESGAGDAPPGFGATLNDVSAEARQLVYRYVKNREPLFHDDL